MAKNLERLQLGKLVEKIIYAIDCSLESVTPLSGEICLTMEENALFSKFDLAEHLEKWGYRNETECLSEYFDPSSVVKIHPTTPAPLEQRVFPPFSLKPRTNSWVKESKNLSINIIFDN